MRLIPTQGGLNHAPRLTPATVRHPRPAAPMRAGGVVRVDRHPYGPRVYLAGRRIHHGSAGLVLAVALRAARRRKLSYLALLAVAHDARDFPFRDCDNHNPRRHHA